MKDKCDLRKRRELTRFPGSRLGDDRYRNIFSELHGDGSKVVSLRGDAPPATRARLRGTIPHHTDAGGQWNHSHASNNF